MVSVCKSDGSGGRSPVRSWFLCMFAPLEKLTSHIVVLVLGRFILLFHFIFYDILFSFYFILSIVYFMYSFILCLTSSVS